MLRRDDTDGRWTRTRLTVGAWFLRVKMNFCFGWLLSPLQHLSFSVPTWPAVLREKGNKAFARGDYETAVRFYSEGLDQLRDVQTLYTNRAQVPHMLTLQYFSTSSATLNSWIGRKLIGDTSLVFFVSYIDLLCRPLSNWRDIRRP